MPNYHHLIRYYSNTGLSLWGKKLETIADVAIAPWTKLFPVSPQMFQTGMDCNSPSSIH